MNIASFGIGLVIGIVIGYILRIFQIVFNDLKKKNPKITEDILKSAGFR